MKTIQGGIIFRNDQRNWSCLTQRGKTEMWHLTSEAQLCAGLLDVYSEEYSSAFLLPSIQERHIKKEDIIIKNSKCECYEDQIQKGQIMTIVCTLDPTLFYFAREGLLMRWVLS